MTYIPCMKCGGGMPFNPCKCWGIAQDASHVADLRAELARVTVEALDWRAQVGELSDMLRAVKAERNELRTAAHADAEAIGALRADRDKSAVDYCALMERYDALQVQLATARADALREAAAYLKTEAGNWAKHGMPGCSAALRSEAQAILALIDTPQPAPAPVTVGEAARVLLAALPNYAMERAALESRAMDDEGPFESLSDLLGFSGQNKSYTVVRQALFAALRAIAGEPRP